MRVPIKDTGGDELIKDANDEGRKNREKDVVERKRPRFICDLPRKVVVEGILYNRE